MTVTIKMLQVRLTQIQAEVASIDRAVIHHQEHTNRHIGLIYTAIDDIRDSMVTKKEFKAALNGIDMRFVSLEKDMGEVKEILATLVQTCATTEELHELRAELQGDFKSDLHELRAELKGEFRAGLDELRAELQGDFRVSLQEIRTELKADMHELRTELRSEFKAGLDGLRTELKSDMQELRNELQSELKDGLDGLRAEFKADMHELRVELKADIHELRTELKELKDLILERLPISQAAS